MPGAPAERPALFFLPYDRRMEREPDAHRERAAGQSLAEYALIVALIVIVALVALTFFGTQINDVLSVIADTING
jgi:Flp pilus assembly pilin Flp